MASALNASDPSRFADRHDAGRQLAERLGDLRQMNPVVIGIAPNAMPIAAEIARALGAPLDTVAVAPLMLGETHRDRVGTAAEGGIAFFEDAQIDAQPEAVDAVLIRTQQRLERCEAIWHRGSPRHSLHRRSVLLIGELSDDAEIAVAACAVRDRGAVEVTYAAPQVRLADAMAVGDWVDQIICIETVAEGRATWQFPGDRQQVSDEEINALLRENDSDQHPTEPRSPQ